MNMTVDNAVAEQTPSLATDKRFASHRPHRASGSFAFAAVVVAAANRPNPEEPVSLLQSWLPLGGNNFSRTGPAGYRHPGVIPVLGTNNLTRVAPSIDAYAAERNWVTQPALFFYRPQALVDLIGEDGLVRDLPKISRTQVVEDRVYIDVSVSSEMQAVLQTVLNLCLKVIDEAGIKPSHYVESSNPRIALSGLLVDFPFLVHHIFKAFPKLHVLRHRAKVNGREEVINHIRYRRKEAYGLNTERLYRKTLINVEL